MELKSLTKKQLNNLAEKLGCNPEHLQKVARGSRPCSKKMAEGIERETFGAIKKEYLLWPTAEKLQEAMRN